MCARKSVNWLENPTPSGILEMKGWLSPSSEGENGRDSGPLLHGTLFLPGVPRIHVGVALPLG